METKLYGYLAIVIAIMLATAGFVHYSDINEVRGKISDTEASIRTSTAAIEAIKEQIDHKRQAAIDKGEFVAKEEDLVARPAQLTEEIEASKKRTEAKTQETISLEQEFSQTVLAVRNAAVGKELPTLELKNGKTLSAVKIKRISEDTVSVSHSVGSSRLHKADLPVDWSERYQLVDPAPSATVASSTPGAPPVPQPVITRVAPDAGKLAALKSQIASVSAQIHIVEGNVKLWEARQSDAEAKRGKGTSVTTTDIYGGTTTTTRSKIIGAGNFTVESSRTAKEAAQKQLNLLEAQLIKLNSELQTMNTGG